MKPRTAALVAGALLAVPSAGHPAGQDANILLPVDTLEQRLVRHTFEIASFTGSRFEDDRTQRVTLAFPDGKMILVKWARAAVGGERFNNVPRYELAAYELQKLFLEEPEYVVPPTVLRSLPLAWYRRELDDRAQETFRGTGSILVLLQYWLWNVRGGEVWDEKRFERDPEYARHFANFNILTYLVRHSDSNEGNFLISSDTTNPRVFAVDNGVAFHSEKSARGDRMRRLRAPRLPVRTVERLRRVGPEELAARLGVLAQFELAAPDRLVAAPPGPNLDPGDGIRRRDGVIQLGLTESEIEGVASRLRELLGKVDAGDYGLF